MPTSVTGRGSAALRGLAAQARLPRRRPEARAAGRDQPRRGRADQRRRAPRNVAEACRAAGARGHGPDLHRQGGQPDQRHGRHQAHRRAGIARRSTWRRRRQHGGTRFVTVRFGNVLGSTGSVVPLFQRQLAAGGPLTVTHPEIDPLLHDHPRGRRAGARGLGAGCPRPRSPGSIFVLDMGKPVRILDLARQMIRLAGRKPDKDVAIEFVGLDRARSSSRSCSTPPSGACRPASPASSSQPRAASRSPPSTTPSPSSPTPPPTATSTPSETISPRSSPATISPPTIVATLLPEVPSLSVVFTGSD